MTRDDGTVARTPVEECPACREKRLHLPTELIRYHRYTGHGFDRGQWTDPMLDPLAPLKLRGTPDPEENR